MTIAAATAISALNSLTLSPALGAILLRPADAPRRIAWTAGSTGPSGAVFRGFNRGFDSHAGGYGAERWRRVRPATRHWRSRCSWCCSA